MSRFRTLTIAAVGVFPASRLKNAVLRSLGCRIGRGVTIGPVVILNVENLALGEGARIGPFNVFRSLKSVTIEDFGRIGQWNWISAAPDLRLIADSGTFLVGAHAAITSRHYFDCSGGISIGAFTTVAGVRSTFITHGIDWRTSEQSVRSIRVGRYCLISSNTGVVPGTTVSDYVVTGMGATISGNLSEPGLYVAGRAQPVKVLNGAYFARATGVVKPPRNY